MVKFDNGHNNGKTMHDEINGAPKRKLAKETALVVPPDGGWGWVVVAASFMCNFLVDGIILSGGILSKPIQLEFNVTDKEVAPVNSLLAGFYLMAGPFVSALANRYGFRVVTIIGSLIASTAFVLSYFATSVQYLYILYGVLGGLGFCMIYMPAVVVVGYYFEKWRALATGLALCGSGVGTFILAPLTDKLIESYGWRNTLLVHAGLIMLCIIFGALFRPIEPKPMLVINVEEDSHEENTSANFVLKRPLVVDKRLQTLIPRNFSDIIKPQRYEIEEQFLNSDRSKRRASENPNTAINIIEAQKRAIPKCTRNCCKDDLEKDNTEPLLLRSSTVLSNKLHRDDMFYYGSLKRIPQYTSYASLQYHLAVTHTDEPEKHIGRCQCVPNPIRKLLSTMLDFSLFKSITFVILAVSGIFTFLGLFVPYMYVKQRAEDHAMDKTQSVLLVSTIGVANIVGRIASGVISSFPQISSLLVYNIALTVGGISTMISGLYFSSLYQFCYCVLFGLSIACFASLRSILVVEYIGLEKLTNCFGLFLLFQGFGALLGSPIAGALIDMTGDYNLAFYISGGFLLISAVICYPVEYISKWEKMRA